MKLVGHYNKMPIYSDPNCPPDTVYLINDEIKINSPLRKDGKPDRRYYVNKLIQL